MTMLLSLAAVAVYLLQLLMLDPAPDVGRNRSIPLTIEANADSGTIQVTASGASRFYMDCDCSSSCSTWFDCNADCAPWSQVDDPLPDGEIMAYEANLEGCNTAWSGGAGTFEPLVCALSPAGTEQSCESVVVDVTTDIALPTNLAGFRIILVWGQSQMVGYSQVQPFPTADSPQSHWVLNRRSGADLDKIRWDRVFEPFASTVNGMRDGSDETHTLSGPVTSFVNRWEADKSEQVIVLMAAVGSTGLVSPVNWRAHPTAPGPQYVDALDMVTQLVSGRSNAVVSAILWTQGWTDGINSVTAGDYETALLNMFTSANTEIKAITGQVADIVMVAALPFTSNAGNPGIGAIRTGTLDAIAADADVYQGPDQDSYTKVGDGLHLSEVVEFGRDFAILLGAVL